MNKQIEREQNQTEYCLQTNCMGCNLNPGNYKQCPYFQNKIAARLDANNSDKA